MYISRNSVKGIRASVKDIAIKRFRDIGSLQIREMTFKWRRYEVKKKLKFERANLFFSFFFFACRLKGKKRKGRKKLRLKKDVYVIAYMYLEIDFGT